MSPALTDAFFDSVHMQPSPLRMTSVLFIQVAMRHGVGDRNFADELGHDIRTDLLVDEKLKESIGHGLALRGVDADHPFRIRAIEILRHCL